MALISGVQLALLIGATVPLPAPEALVSALVEAEVSHSDTGRSGFQLTFQAGRGQGFGAVDYPLLRSRLLRPYSRVILVARVGVVPRVLIDGVIGDVQFSPGDGPGAATVSVSGEDLTVLMDLEERIASYPSQSEPMIAAHILARYARYGVAPMIIPPPSLDLPLPIERIPVQHGSDMAYLKRMAARFAYDFYLMPGPLPGASLAYWGPPRRIGVPQRALTAGIGAADNLLSISFQYDGGAAEEVAGSIIDRRSGRAMPVRSVAVPYLPLARTPPRLAQSQVRKVLPDKTQGLTVVDALLRAQARTNASLAGVVSASGQLDAVRYGGLLEVRRLVGVRGVGDTFDGIYYVQRVSHSISPRDGTYKQSFTLTREGVGAITPVVIP
jgi:hypothetical protein